MMKLTKTFAAAMLLLAPCQVWAQKQQKESLQISRLHGELALHTAAGPRAIKPCEAGAPLHSPSEISVSSGWAELSCRGMRLRVPAGSLFTASEEEDGMSLQTSTGSASLQLTDAAGNVAVLTESSSLRVLVDKKQIRYKTLSGKVVLTNTDGETFILKPGDERSASLGKHLPDKTTQEAPAAQLHESTATQTAPQQETAAPQTDGEPTQQKESSK